MKIGRIMIGFTEKELQELKTQKGGIMKIGRIMTGFTEKELQELKKYNWQKLLHEARPLSRRLNGCENCQKKDTPLAFHLDRSHMGKKRVIYDYLAFFCSVPCFQAWRISGKRLYQRKLPAENNVHERILFDLSEYSLNELRDAQDFDFQKAIRLEIKNYEKKQWCDYCCKNRKAGYNIYASWPKHRSLARGDFCSKKCLLLALEKKIKR